jgi:surfeit locus 1 family protein
MMMAMLIGLGTWQIYRLHWKERILRQIAAAEAAPPVPLGPHPSSYQKISVNGRFLFDRAAMFGAEVRDTNRGPTLGSHQIVPLVRQDGDPIILVDRGWIPEKRDTPLNDPAAAVTVTGYVRPREIANWFSAPDDPAARLFYTLDPVSIGSALNIQAPAPFTVVALGTPAPGTFPIPAEHLPRPPNNHLSYVITWYGLAVALAIIFAVWVRKALWP